MLNQCPLLGVKRTLIGRALMSAFDPKRTFDLWRFGIYFQGIARGMI